MTSPMRQRKQQQVRAAIAQAALDLFAADGFETVTLAEVAQAADVGQRTLFRYFTDKEELLFGDDEALREHLREALAARPAEELPVVALLQSLVGLAPFWQDARDSGRTRRLVIERSPALRARELAKHAAYQQVLADGLAARGLDRRQARLLARVAVACTVEAVTRWFDDDHPGRPGLTTRIQEAFAEVGLLRHPAARSQPVASDP